MYDERNLADERPFLWLFLPSLSTSTLAHVLVSFFMTYVYEMTIHEVIVREHFVVACESEAFFRTDLLTK